MTRVCSTVALALLAALGHNSAMAQPIRVDITDNIFKCKDVVVFNNSNQMYDVFVDWEYNFSDGYTSRGSTIPIRVYPNSKASSSMQHADTMQRCGKVAYNMRISNYRWAPAR